MPVRATGSPADDSTVTVRIAAAGDLHCGIADLEATRVAFAELGEDVDLVLLAGDLTTHGEPDQVRILARACQGVAAPVITVLGNHDLHADRRDELVGVLQDAGITVLDPGWTTCRVAGRLVGVVGVKGFVGGFPGCSLPDFGEPSLRRLYAETGADVQALEHGLREIEMCEFRIVLMHYAPTAATLEGEPEGIWAFLGCERLAGPIAEHAPDLVLHGHAHAGRFEGALAGVPVFNVSIPVLGRAFWCFELTKDERALVPVH